MYLLEKIGELMLVTLEGPVTDEEVKAIKKQLVQSIEGEEDEVVVSFYQHKPDGTKIPVKQENRQQEIIDFCIQHNIRIYSYFSDKSY